MQHAAAAAAGFTARHNSNRQCQGLPDGRAAIGSKLIDRFLGQHKPLTNRMQYLTQLKLTTSCSGLGEFSLLSARNTREKGDLANGTPQWVAKS
jgi:hypothetical protein